MIKNIVIVVLVLFFVGCSSVKQNISQDINKIKHQVDTNSEAVITQNKISKPMNFNFNGQWNATNYSTFLIRRINLKQERDNYAHGFLEFAYKDSNNSIVVANKFDLSIYIKDFETIMYIFDKENNQQEEAKLFRDSYNEFRIIPKENSNFFENKYVMFKRVTPIITKEVIEKKVVLNHKKINNTMKKEIKKQEVKVIGNNLIWQDSIASKTIKASFDNAQIYCELLAKENFNWRLPSRIEILNKYKDINKFNYYSNGCYWTSQESIDDIEKAWCFDYQTGKELIKDKNEKLHIRCVRKK